MVHILGLILAAFSGSLLNASIPKESVNEAPGPRAHIVKKKKSRLAPAPIKVSFVSEQNNWSVQGSPYLTPSHFDEIKTYLSQIIHHAQEGGLYIHRADGIALMVLDGRHLKDAQDAQITINDYLHYLVELALSHAQSDAFRFSHEGFVELSKKAVTSVKYDEKLRLLKERMIAQAAAAISNNACLINYKKSLEKQKASTPQRE